MERLYFADNIKYLREEHKITQEELGKRVSKTNTTIAKWESGVATPSVSVAKNLAEIFHIEITDLLYKDLRNGILDDETKLLSFFRTLNDEGKAKLLDYADDLVQSKKYTELNISEVV